MEKEIVQTYETVPVCQSLFMAEALSEAGIPFELHIYEEEPHGLSLATQATAVITRSCFGLDEAGVQLVGGKILNDERFEEFIRSQIEI